MLLVVPCVYLHCVATGNRCRGADDPEGCAEAKPPTPGAEGTEPFAFDAGDNTQGPCAGPRDFDQVMYGINTAAQDSFRQQLADLRDNLNKASSTVFVTG